MELEQENLNNKSDKGLKAAADKTRSFDTSKIKEMQDLASLLEHLQSILQEFDEEGAPEESDLIRFFREGLKPSIKTQMEQHGRELDS